jgi:transcriptional regulator with XRE-family HTH domain
MPRKKTEATRTRDQRIGNRLRYLRQEADMTLEEVAEAIEMSMQIVHKYEIGEVSMSTERLEQLARLFKVAPWDIIGWTLTSLPARDKLSSAGEGSKAPEPVATVDPPGTPRHPPSHSSKRRAPNV